MKTTLRKSIWLLSAIILLFGLRLFGDTSKQSSRATSLGENCRVTRVVDGDTFDAVCGSATERVRLLGVDTPETVDPRRPVGCFGREASAFAKKTLEGKTVKMEADDSQGDRDKYGRLLRYVWLADGQLFNLSIIERGFGFEYTYDIPYGKQSVFQNAEKQASFEKVGLWAENACRDSVDQPPTVANPSSSIAGSSSPSIKKSRTNICHDKSSMSFDDTKIFTPFATMSDCLKSGGRLPKSKP